MRSGRCTEHRRGATRSEPLQRRPSPACRHPYQRGHRPVRRLRRRTGGIPDSFGRCRSSAFLALARSAGPDVERIPTGRVADRSKARRASDGDPPTWIQDPSTRTPPYHRGRGRNRGNRSQPSRSAPPAGGFPVSTVASHQPPRRSIPISRPSRATRYRRNRSVFPSARRRTRTVATATSSITETYPLFSIGLGVTSPAPHRYPMNAQNAPGGVPKTCVDQGGCRTSIARRIAGPDAGRHSRSTC